MSLRLKVKCQSVKHMGGTTPAREYLLTPVYGQGNESWSRYTPSGIIQFTVTNPEAPELAVDKEYFVDVAEVPTEASPST